MAFNIQLAQFVRGSSSNAWTQVVEFNPTGTFEYERLGHLFAMVSVSTSTSGLSGSAIDKALLVRNISLSLQNNYYKAVSSDVVNKNPLERLKSAVEKVVIENKAIGKLEIAACVLVKDVIYLTSYGGVKIYLLRDGSLVQILSTAINEAKSGSGFIRNSDNILAGTSLFFTKYPSGVIKTLLTNDNLDFFSQKFFSEASSLTDSGNLAAIVARFHIKLKTLALGESVINSPEDVGGEVRDFTNEFQVSQDGVSQKSGIKDKIKSIFKKITDKKLYVYEDETPEMNKKRKASASVGIILLFLLITSIFFGLRQKRENEVKNSYEQELALAKHDLSEAENLITLNPERARQLFIDGRGKVLGMADRGIEDPELQDLKNKIEAAQGKILGEYRVSTELFVDLDLLSSGFRGEELSISGGVIYTIDKNGKKISKTVVSTKRSEIVAGPNMLKEANDAAAYQNDLYIFNSEGIFDVTNQNAKVSEDVWGGGILAQGYSGNLYVLEKSNSQIWRLAGAGGIFGSKKAWLSEDTIVDLSDAGSWAIDGNIWIPVGKTIYRFSGGNRINFKLESGALGDFNIDYIFTNDETDSLYIMDSVNGRVLVFNKEGEYKCQYIDEAINEISAFAVFEDEKKMILLSSDKLLSIKLEHLN